MELNGRDDFNSALMDHVADDREQDASGHIMKGAGSDLHATHS